MHTQGSDKVKTAKSAFLPLDHAGALPNTGVYFLFLVFIFIILITYLIISDTVSKNLIETVWSV